MRASTAPSNFFVELTGARQLAGDIFLAFTTYFASLREGSMQIFSADRELCSDTNEERNIVRFA